MLRTCEKCDRVKFCSEPCFICKSIKVSEKNEPCKSCIEHQKEGCNLEIEEE